MVDTRKKAVSLRLSAADLRKVKRVSERLDVRDSDVIRFAIKLLLARLSPLSDPAIKGRALVPLFLEPGAEFVRHFDLDAARLDAVINGGVDDPSQRVSLDDLHLIAMTGGTTAGPSVPPMPPRQPQGYAVAANGLGGPGANGAGTAGATLDRRSSPTRRYLYDKYLAQAPKT